MSEGSISKKNSKKLCEDDELLRKVLSGDLRKCWEEKVEDCREANVYLAEFLEEERKNCKE